MPKGIETRADKSSLKPLRESAIENQKKALKSGLAHMQARLDEFERRLAARELEEAFDFTDWRMEIGMRIVRVLHGKERHPVWRRWAYHYLTPDT